MSPGSRRALLALIALVAIAGVVTIGAVGATGQAAAYAQQDGPTSDINDSQTVLTVSLQGDSDARWTITQHFNVSTPHERAAFEELADRFSEGRTNQLGLSAFQRALERVEPTVDRPMRIHEVTRETSVEDGTLQLSFTWTNFAREDNETRIVDDAFTTPGGTWLNGLGPNQSLVIELPPGSALDTPKEMTDGAMRWDGPTEFEPGYLQISYTANPAPAIPPILWGVAVGLLVFAVVGVVGGYLLSRRDGLSRPSLPIGGGASDAKSPEPPSTETDADVEGADGAAADQGDTSDAVEEEDDGVDLSLLSDEERVEYLIEENGGRMKQANIVKETGWSNAKVSQLLSAMEEDGRIAKLRIGRENLISFPDEDIGDFEDT